MCALKKGPRRLRAKVLKPMMLEWVGMRTPRARPQQLTRGWGSKVTTPDQRSVMLKGLRTNFQIQAFPTLVHFFSLPWQGRTLFQRPTSPQPDQSKEDHHHLQLSYRNPLAREARFMCSKTPHTWAECPLFHLHSITSNLLFHRHYEHCPSYLCLLQARWVPLKIIYYFPENRFTFPSCYPVGNMWVTGSYWFRELSHSHDTAMLWCFSLCTLTSLYSNPRGRRRNSPSPSTLYKNDKIL